MKTKVSSRILWIAAIGMILMIIGLVVSAGMAEAQGNPPNPEAYVTTSRDVNPYFTEKDLSMPDGRHLTMSVIKGPATPPGGLVAQKASALLATPASAVTLEVPAFNWVFGCSAVSGSMVAGYYDRHGYPNIYTGPTNGGVYPLVEDPAWGTWTDAIGDVYPNNPLIASHNGVDGLAIKGSIDDYWISYLSSANDPFITGGWAQHAWGTSIGDTMKTSQSSYNNVDGSTSFYGYNSATKLQCSAMGAVAQYDGTYGRKLFYEARGYTVTDCYSQATSNRFSGGFSLTNYKAEIDAGHPVFINLAGHSIVGVGYDTASSTIYVHDTWDNSTHTMTWGGSYSNMTTQSVSIVNLATVATNPPAAPTNVSASDGTYTDKVVVSWTASTGATSYQVFRGATNDSSTAALQGTASASPYNDTSPAATTVYWYFVKACNSAGCSDPSTGNDGYRAALPAPGAFSKTAPANGATNLNKVTLTWSASSNATSYQYCYSTSSTTCSNWVNNGTSTKRTLSGLNRKTTYYWQVRAVNSAGTTYANGGTATTFWSFKMR